MLTTARIVSRRVVTANIAPRAAAAVGSTRCMSIADQLGKKVRTIKISFGFTPIIYSIIKLTVRLCCYRLYQTNQNCNVNTGKG